MVKVGAIRYCLVKNSEGSRRVAGRVVEVTSETVVLSGQPVPNAHTVPSQTGSDSLSFLSVPAGVVTAQLPSGWKKPLDLPSAAACGGMCESLGGGEVVSSQAECPLVKPAAVRKTPVAEDLDFSSLIHLFGFLASRSRGGGRCQQRRVGGGGDQRLWAKQRVSSTRRKLRRLVCACLHAFRRWVHVQWRVSACVVSSTLHTLWQTRCHGFAFSFHCYVDSFVLLCPWAITSWFTASRKFQGHLSDFGLFFAPSIDPGLLPIFCRSFACHIFKQEIQIFAMSVCQEATIQTA